MDKRIGAQMYTIRDYMKTLEDFEDAVKQLRKIGYTHGQLSGVGNIATAEQFRDVCERNDFFISSTHRSWEAYSPENIDNTIAFHKTLGAKFAGIGGCWLPGAYTVEELDSRIDYLNEATEKLNAEGIDFTYHNHAHEFIRLDNGQYFFDRLLERGKFKFVLDVYWLTIAGVNPTKKITEMGDRLAVVHFKDLKIKANSVPFYTEVGNGNIDFGEIINASQKAAWAVVEQDECEDYDPMKSLEISYNYLTTKYDFI